MRQNVKTGLRRVTETGVLLALLIVLQAATRSAGQYVTGTCVNAVLALAVLTAGLWSGAAVAVLSPFFAFLLGIGPQLLPIVPAIAAGNAVFAVLLWALAGRGNPPLGRRVLAWPSAAAGKFLTLYLLVVRLLCALLPLQPQQTALFTAMFSWPQLVTALAGGGLALLAAPPLRWALKRQRRGTAGDL